MVAHVLFWIGVSFGSFDALTNAIAALKPGVKAEESKVKAGICASGFFLAAAAVAKYLGY